MFNKFNKWFHSSRVKISFVNMSASWFWVSMYLIWILGSRLTRSNNQSSATLKVRETCLIVGLLPFIIILITASLSSNTYNKASRLADWTFEGTESMSWITSIFYEICFYHSQVAPFDLKYEKYFQEQTQLDPIVPEQATHPISVQCPERWFQNLLNCEKQQFVSCTSNLLEQMYDFQKCSVPPEVDFESSRSPAKSESYLDHCFVVFKEILQSFRTRRMHVWGNKTNIVQIIGHSLRLFSFLNCVRCWTNFTLVRTQVSPFLITLIRVSKNCDDQIP